MVSSNQVCGRGTHRRQGRSKVEEHLVGPPASDEGEANGGTVNRGNRRRYLRKLSVHSDTAEHQTGPVLTPAVLGVGIETWRGPRSGRNAQHGSLVEQVVEPKPDPVSNPSRLARIGLGRSVDGIECPVPIGWLVRAKPAAMLPLHLPGLNAIGVKPEPPKWGRIDISHHFAVFEMLEPVRELLHRR